MIPPIFLAGLVAIQALCAFCFVSDILLTIVGLRVAPISWQTRELLEMGAALGLSLGMILGWIVFRRTARAGRAAAEKLRRASSAFLDLMDERFSEWGLTTAERDVALFAIKGLSTAEIAQLRGTSEGTIKAQTAAIYRKAGVTGRPQLLSLFIEDLMDDTAASAPEPSSVTAA